MRRTLLVGLVLLAAAVVVVVVSAAFDLELEPVVLLGVAMGAVLALVPDRSPGMRLAGFAAGFTAAWIGYFARAALLPDSVAGRSVGVGLVVVLCVLVAALSMDRVALWSTLLGAAALSGAYEYTYAAAPPEVASTSMTTATSVLFTAAVGFLAVALATPASSTRPGGAPRHGRPQGTDDVRLDEMMETTK